MIVKVLKKAVFSAVCFELPIARPYTLRTLTLAKKLFVNNKGTILCQTSMPSKN